MFIVAQLTVGGVVLALLSLIVSSALKDSGIKTIMVVVNFAVKGIIIRIVDRLIISSVFLVSLILITILKDPLFAKTAK